MTVPLIIIAVHGDPAGQGNLKGTASGKLRHANGSELRDWRERIRAAALDATGRHEFVAPSVEHAARGGVSCGVCSVRRKAHAELVGPVRMEAIVTVPRPKSVTAGWPITRSSSDYDHYARAIGDALTGVVYADDSQVTDGRLIKTYPHVHEHALSRPGAVIRIWSVQT